MGEEVVYRQDWLGIRPYFYNSKSGQHGCHLNEAFNLQNFELCTAGVSDFLTFGYSVFGSTPVQNVKFVPANHTLRKKSDGSLYVSRDEFDPVNAYLEKTSEPADALDLLLNWNHEEESNEEILPLSSGMDSRLLALNRVRHRKIPHCYTYGTSRRQWDSDEVHGAREIARSLNLPWQRVELTGFHQEISPWRELFGSSVHLHGMYQLRFYREISKQHKSGTVISGIIGDLWARSHSLSPPRRALDLRQYSYNHGLGLPDAAINRRLDTSNLESEFEQLGDSLDTELGRTAYLVRTKMMLLSYLKTVPESFGFSFASPFLDSEIALTIASIDRKQRHDRLWLKKFFDTTEVPVPEHPVGTRSPFLDLGELQRNPLPPLSPSLLSRYVDPAYIEKVNSYVRKISVRGQASLRLLEMRRIGPSVGRRLWEPELQSSYNSYMCLRPIQDLIEVASGDQKFGRNP